MTAYSNIGSYRRLPSLSKRWTGTGWNYTTVQCVVMQRDSQRLLLSTTVLP